MADNFDLQGWMRENKQGPFAGLNQETFKSSKPKSKTGLNESLMGMIDLQPVGSLSEDLEEEMMDDDEEVMATPKGMRWGKRMTSYKEEDEEMLQGPLGRRPGLVVME